MIKFKFELIPEKGVVYPYVQPYGYIFRALLMNWLKELEPKLVHELHSYNKVRPYSLKVSYRKDMLVFFLNIFDPAIANILINNLINKKNKTFIINKQTFLLKKVVFEDFSLETMLKRGKQVKNFKIEFVEPTYFNTTRSSNVIRLPIPEMIFFIFSNLWNSLYDGVVKIEKEVFLEWVNQNIFPSSLKIRTKAKQMGENVPAVGIIGWVNFEIDKNNSNYAKYVDVLCRFGELSNLGGNRTAGLGVINYTPIEFFNGKKKINSC